jgi:hypothetical protein
MMKDPIVEEVRKVRRKIEADCKKQGISIFEYYRKQQEQYKGRLVNRGPQFLYRTGGKTTTRRVAEPSATKRKR